jgi:hypothetical protein
MLPVVTRRRERELAEAGIEGCDSQSITDRFALVDERFAR